MTDMATVATAVPEELELGWGRHRVEITGYCYRMLGSSFDAEDAAQETLVRAWRSFGGFEGRSSLRSWLYRIATNVCLTMLAGRKRRARPMDMGPAGTSESTLGPPLVDSVWVQPAPDARVLPMVSAAADPAEQAVSRESVRLAFVAALQHLPPKQRAVLILREVLQWSAAEVAALLGGTVASVNSALQRARATLAGRGLSEADQRPVDDEHGDLLARYTDAFERYDMEALVALLHEDATLSMPPYDLWMRGVPDIRRWFTGPGAKCAGSRLLPVAANGMPGFGQYRPSGPDGRHEAWALQVLEIVDGRIVGFNAFLDTPNLFPLFGLPLQLD